MLNVGIKGQAECLVTEKNTAATMGSGALQVYATPAMIALVEKAAWESVQPYLEEGSGTVGTELIAVEGRKLVFKVEVFDQTGKIGEGEHERFIVANEKFFAKAQAKKNQ